MVFPTFPVFDELDDLTPVYNWEEAPSFLFISHSYAAGKVDDRFQTKFRILKLILKKMKQITHIWIDYSCSKDIDHTLASLCDIVHCAQRVILLPLQPGPHGGAPSIAIPHYTGRAWCAVESAICLSRNPSKVRVASVQAAQFTAAETFHLELLSVPAHDNRWGLRALVQEMRALRELVEAKDTLGFLRRYQESRPGDKERLWAFLDAKRFQVFQHAGLRRNSDFFVRTRHAEKGTAYPEPLYDEATQKKLKDGEAASIFCCFMALH